ncbi:MAG: hypothetical protein KIG60_02505, partial [Caryophanon sp.]|nr:hypothetical protein [Caryophanon sp.]
AEFGTEMGGVFNKDYLDEESSIAYAFHESRKPDGPIAIGVDWDKQLSLRLQLHRLSPSDLVSLLLYNNSGSHLFIKRPMTKHTPWIV